MNQKVKKIRLFEETVESRVIFRGKIVTLREDVARLENGTLASREVVEHPDGVCILPMEYSISQKIPFRYTQVNESLFRKVLLGYNFGGFHKSTLK